MTPCVWFYRRLTWSWTVTYYTSQNWQFAQDEKRERQSCAGWVNLLLQKDTHYRHCRHYSLIFIYVSCGWHTNQNNILMENGSNKWINVCVCVCILETRNREPTQRTHIAVSFPTCLSLWPLGADRFIVSGCLPAKKTFNTFYLHRCRHAMLTLIVFCRSAVAFTAQRYMLPKIPKWTTSKYLRHLILNHMIWTTPRFKLCFIQNDPVWSVLFWWEIGLFL